MILGRLASRFEEKIIEDLLHLFLQVALALTCRKQEAIKLEMEESLQPREIKMIVPSKSVKL